MITQLKNELEQYKDYEADVNKNPRNSNIIEAWDTGLKFPVTFHFLYQEINQAIKDTEKRKSNEEREKEEEKQINLLLSQGQPKNNYKELSAIIGKLKKYRATNTYQKHEQEINQLETKLKNLDQNKYRSTVKDSLGEQVKNNDLKEEELSEETKNKIREAKDTGELEKVKEAEELIAKEGANKELIICLKLIENFLANMNKTQQEKNNLIKQLSTLITRDPYTKSAYQTRQQEVDKALTELKGINDTQNPSFLPLYLCLIGLFLGIVIIGTLVIKKKSKKVC